MYHIIHNTYDINICIIHEQKQKLSKYSIALKTNGEV